VEFSKSASTSDLRDELADLMMRAAHTCYELTPTSPWIKVTEAIEVMIAEALARHLRAHIRGMPIFEVEGGGCMLVCTQKHPKTIRTKWRKTITA
jgi:hypothetical protein